MGRGPVVYGPHTYGAIRALGHRGNLVLVGKYCSIGENVVAILEDDHRHDFISTYPFGHQDMWISRRYGLPNLPQNYQMRVPLDIKIGNDVWLGYGTTLLRGVTIGDGAVIGALSVVAKDIPPYTIAVGASRIIRKRFSDEDIEFLLKLKWWDFDDETVASIVPILHSNNITALRKWANDRLR